ncbi:MAG: DinB family protein [Gemmatimonadaceae bacterium]
MPTTQADEPGCAVRLRTTVDKAAPRLLAMSLDDAVAHPAPGKWSPVEVIGHLVDSANNNHQRFVRAHAQDDLVFNGYDQDAWVSGQRYQKAPWVELVHLWHLYNRHVARVMSATPREVRERVHDRHNLHLLAFRKVPENQSTTLEYFMNDYVDHLEHHLSQVFS